MKKQAQGIAAAANRWKGSLATPNAVALRPTLPAANVSRTHAAQPRALPPAQPCRPPTAPSVYRSQAVLNVLQRKTAIAPQRPSAQSGRVPVAPPVCRPQGAPKVLQKKVAIASPPAAGRHSPKAPPVYRPQQRPLALQAKQAGMKRVPKPPPQIAPNTEARAAKEPPNGVFQAKPRHGGVNIRDFRPGQVNHNLSRGTHVPPKQAFLRHFGVLQLMETSPGKDKGGPPEEDKGPLPGSGNDNDSNNNSNQDNNNQTSKRTFWEIMKKLPKNMTDPTPRKPFLMKKQVFSSFGVYQNELHRLLDALKKANVSPKGHPYHSEKLNADDPEQKAVLVQIEEAYENLCNYVVWLMEAEEMYFSALCEVGFVANLIKYYKERGVTCNQHAATQLLKLLDRIQCTKPSKKK